MKTSLQLRNETYHLLQQVENDLATHSMVLEYAFRKCIHETSMAIDQLEWQKKQVMSNFIIQI